MESVSQKGLVGEGKIDWWNGTQEAHQDGFTYGYGDEGVKYRVKRTDLAELGFSFEPYPEGNPATHTYNENAVVPTDKLEQWDEKLRLWLPVVGEKE